MSRSTGSTLTVILCIEQGCFRKKFLLQGRARQEYEGAGQEILFGAGQGGLLKGSQSVGWGGTGHWSNPPVA